MKDLKNKMYNYETTPPDGVWNAIAAELDKNEAKVIPIAKKNNNIYYYMAAASVAIILFGLIFFTNRSSKSENEKLVTSSQNNKIQNDVDVNNKVIITVPTEEKTSIKNTADINRTSAQNDLQKNRANQKQGKEVIKNRDTADNKLIANNATPRYITIEGPQGQPVKVSSKMATLIDSTVTSVSSKPVWNKKITEWREIMKANTLAPTTGNFLDIVELTKTLKDKK